MPTPITPPSPIPTATSPPPASPTPAGQGLLGGADVVSVAGWATAVILVVFFILLIVLLVIKKLSGGAGGKYPAVAMLARALSDPYVEAVGIILDMDTGTAEIAPLERVESFYATKSDPPRILIQNPKAQPFSIHGKPLAIFLVSGKLGYQVDPEELTTLGFTQLALESELWSSETDPEKSYEQLIEKILAHTGSLKGRIKLAPGLKLGFQMSPPRVLSTMIRSALNITVSMINSAVDITNAIDSIAERIRETKTREIEARGRFIMMLTFGIAMALLIAALAYYILNTLGGG